MATQRTRTYLLSRFEAGDRPTDQDFADLFESIIFINNDGIHANGLGTDTTSIAGDLNIGGTLDLTGNFKMAAKLSVGDTSQTLNSAISAYNATTHAVVFASGSLSDVMFEGVSQDTTSSIKLTETMAGGSTNTLIFGTAAGRTFIQNDGQEIIHMTSSGHFTNSPQVYISGSLGIGSGWDSGAATGEQLHIQAKGEGNATMRLTSDGVHNDSIIKLRQSNNTGMDLIYDGGIDKFQIKDNSNNLPFQIEKGADTNTLYLDVDGKVGIGTNNPTTKLHVVDSGTIAYSSLANANILVGTTSTGLGFDSNEIFFNGGEGNIGTLSNHNLKFATFASVRMTIEAGGNVGIGTSNPDEKLHVRDASNNVHIRLKTDKVNGRAQIFYQNDAQVYRAGIATNDNFVIFDSTNSTTPFVIQPGVSSNTLTLDDNGNRVGIGTSSPGEKLDVQGVVNSTTDLSATNPDDEGEYRLGSRADFGLKGTNYKAQLQAPNDVIMMIDSNVNDDSAQFMVQKHSSTVDGGTTLFTVDQNGGVTGSAFIGDGSGLTNLTGGQINGLISNGANDRIVTAVDVDSLRGESDFTFDGTDVKLDGNLAIGKGTAGLFTPDSPLHIKHTGDSLGNSDLIHLSMHSTTTEGNISIKLSDAGDVAGQHFKMTFGEGNNDLKFHSDATDNILYLEHDGDVGIGTDNPDEKLSVAGGNIELTSTGKIGFNVSDDIGSYTVTDPDGTTTATASDQVAHYGLSRPDTAIQDPVVLAGYYGLDFVTNGVFRMKIKQNGKIGIGTANPQNQLHVKDDTSDLYVRLETDKADGRAQIIFQNDAQQWQAGINTADAFIIYDATSGHTVFQINSDAPASQIVLESNNIDFGTKITIEEGLRIQSLTGADSLTNNYDGVFDGETGTLRRHELSFPAAAGSNDPGFIFHHTSTSTTNSSTINLCPGDDQGSQDYVAIHGYDEPEMIRLFTTGEGHFRGGLGVGELWNDSGASINGSQISAGKIHVKSNADACLVLEADVNNSGESDNAYIRFTQDGNGVTGYAGFTGDANKDPEGNSATNILTNSMYIGTDTDEPVQLVTNNTARLTVDSGGKVIIGSSDNTSLANDYTLQLRDGGMAIDSNNNNDSGFIHQGGNGSGIGLLGNHSRVGNDLLDLYVSDNGRVSIGNPPSTSHVLNIQSAASNTDVVSIFSANNGDRIVQLSEFSTGDGGIELLDSSGNSDVRIRAEGTSFIKGGALAIGHNNPGITTTGHVHIKSATDIPLRVESTDSFSGISLQDDSTTVGFIGVAAQGDMFRIRTDNTTRMSISPLGRVSINNVAQGDPYLVFGGADLDGEEITAEIRRVTNQNGLQIACDSSLILHAGDKRSGANWDNLIGVAAGTTAENVHITSDGNVHVTTDMQDTSASTGANKEDHHHFTFGTNGCFEIGNKNSSNNIGSRIGADGNGAAPRLFIKSLHQGSNTNGNCGGGIRLADNDTDNYFDIAFINDILTFSHKNSTNTERAFIITRTNHSTVFTGQHLNLPSVGNIEDYKNKVGYIVISSGEGYVNVNQVSDPNILPNSPNINEALPKVALSTQANDKRVFGVISNAEDENGERNYKLGTIRTFSSIGTDNRLIINSVGEGAIMVCNINGNIENGDYITTSEIEGLGMKQDDDLLHNYTVAKITQDEDFTSGTTDVIHGGQTYKAKLVGCTYHCG